MEYEEVPDKNKKRKIFKKKELDMESKVETKRPTTKKVDKVKNTLSIYTYLNFKQFGIAVRIDDGIKVTLAWFETHIKFEKK